MNDETFTPALDYAREMYADNRYHRHDEDYAEALAQFDRMVVEHDRAVEARGFEKGWLAVSVELDANEREVNPISGLPFGKDET